MKYHVVVVVFVAGVFDVGGDYWRDRNAIITSERKKAMGAAVRLSEREEKVNEILMKYKFKELDDGLLDSSNFLAAQHFFKARRGIEMSKVFNIIKRIPKGASLHSHDLGLVSEEYLFSLTYRENLYACIGQGPFRLKFFKKGCLPTDCNWQLVSDLRASNSTFDSFLRSKLSLVVDEPGKTYSSLDDVWKAFEGCFIAVIDMICYEPIFKEYFYEALKELYEDNVKYMEFRGILCEVYDEFGKTYNRSDVIGMYFDTFKKFQRNYPDFQGAKFIYGPYRKVDNETFDQYIKTFTEIRQKYPDFIAGFDLVGQEDLGYPLSSFIDKFLYMKQAGIPFFFHAGETNWNGATTDLNLFDAVLLGTKRIGHGFALTKHPHLMNLVKRNDIAVEICPISNQVLKLVDDIRNHPGAVFLANNISVVLAPDDPTFWGARGLSYDWYLAFMGMANRNDDLRMLKQLAFNSIKYSAMGEEESRRAFQQWKDDWNAFVDEILRKDGVIR